MVYNCAPCIFCRKRYTHTGLIRKQHCLQVRTVLYTYSTGNNCRNLYFMWTVPSEEDVSELLSRSQGVLRKVESTIPVYHTRAMKKQFAHDFDLLAKVEPKVLREMYRHLTGDSSASANLYQTEVDERIHRIVTLQDPEIIDDLRHCNEGRKEKYEVFWENCKEFINASTVHRWRLGS